MAQPATPISKPKLLFGCMITAALFVGITYNWLSLSLAALTQ